MRLLRGILDWFVDPSTLLAFAGMLTVAGLVGGYINVQQRAELELALRQGAPALVAVERFQPGVNVGPAREVHVRARANLDAPLVLTLPGSEKTMLALPLLPLDGDPGTVPGVILIDVAGRGELPDPSTFAGIEARGRGWTEVDVGGVADRAGDFELMVAGALSVQGMRLADRALVVRPFVTSRQAAFRIPENPPRLWLWCLSLASLFVALAGYRGLWAAPRALERQRLYEAELAQASGVPSRPAITPHFQPLPSQEEVNGGRDAGAREASRIGAMLVTAGALVVRSLQGLVGIALRPLVERVANFRSSR